MAYLVSDFSVHCSADKLEIDVKSYSIEFGMYLNNNRCGISLFCPTGMTPIEWAKTVRDKLQGAIDEHERQNPAAGNSGSLDTVDSDGVVDSATAG